MPKYYIIHGIAIAIVFTGIIIAQLFSQLLTLLYRKLVHLAEVVVFYNYLFKYKFKFLLLQFLKQAIIFLQKISSKYRPAYTKAGLSWYLSTDLDYEYVDRYIQQDRTHSFVKVLKDIRTTTGDRTPLTTYQIPPNQTAAYPISHEFLMDVHYFLHEERLFAHHPQLLQSTINPKTHPKEWAIHHSLIETLRKTGDPSSLTMEQRVLWDNMYSSQPQIGTIQNMATNLQFWDHIQTYHEYRGTYANPHGYLFHSFTNDMICQQINVLEECLRKKDFERIASTIDMTRQKILETFNVIIDSVLTHNEIVLTSNPQNLFNLTYYGTATFHRLYGKAGQPLEEANYASLYTSPHLIRATFREIMYPVTLDVTTELDMIFSGVPEYSLGYMIYKIIGTFF